ncbi:feruloyl-CoA synthase [Piscinibacter sakaiensis]|uniref:Long-chain-fatty-acid--CoA ligase n=1 Tax=Piscinibacter sakaiensis TaxID=1547922 RepID=A0A0K8P3P8_PISS1|nr:feruloyl-CoA synthase [Piscinibacter sakaiensis]GAP37237.1 long-chain-fatty-acid--CoA ligase [Piscinibacter sakaiensis]
MPDDFFDDPTQLAPPEVERLELGGGAFVLRHPRPLEPAVRCVGEWIEHWAALTPQAPALAERAPDGSLRRLDYAGLRAAVGAVGQALIELDLPARKPVVILSDNALDHAVLMLAAMHAGRPVCTVSSAYSRLARDSGRIAAILQQLDPALLYASDAALYGPAMATAGPAVPRVFSQGADTVPGALDFERLRRTPEGPALAAAFAAIRPEDPAKYLLTSGSTGQPKVVVNDHRMLCANQQMMRQTWRFLAHERPVLVDWLPWSHTFGGNHNLHLALANGGLLFIDDGRPAPGLVERTVRNLRELRPTLYFNVPRGYDMLLPFLEGDAAFAREFFERLRLAFYAGAALPQSSWERLEAVARRVRGERPVWFTTSWGATETAPAVTTAHWRLDRAGVIGLPLPGTELKFVPNGDKLEMRVRGVNVFPGYRDAPALTAAAFDEDGWYRIGDAGRLLDPERPERGVVFDGRVAEDFKLGSGTWVSVGTLRVRLVSALAPWVQDAVITGHGRDRVGALLFPSPQARSAPPEQVAAALRAGLATLQAEGGGSSQVPTRLLLLDRAPDAEAGEITDKGYVNQRAVLARCAGEVERLHAEDPDPQVLRGA